MSTSAGPGHIVSLVADPVACSAIIHPDQSTSAMDKLAFFQSVHINIVYKRNVTATYTHIHVIPFYLYGFNN